MKIFDLLQESTDPETRPDAATRKATKEAEEANAEEELAEAEFFGDRAEGCGARRGALALRRREVAGLFG